MTIRISTCRIVCTLSLVGLSILSACTPQNHRVTAPTSRMTATKLDSVSVHLPRSSGLYWPTFLSATDGGYYWGEGNQVYRVDPAAPRVEPNRSFWPSVEGHDRLVASATSSNGTLALLDSSGRVSIHDPKSQRTWTLSLDIESHAANLTLAQGIVYVLLQDEEAQRASAVIAYDLDGQLLGEWGSMPLDALIQTSLRGGGITSCPDGSVFYSYINSPRILRLAEDDSSDVHPIGVQSPSFRELLPRDIVEAYRQSNREESVGPVVKLGLSGSRVMSLFCSSSGLLLRQIAQPGGDGSHVEVWDPKTETLLGTVPTTSEMLLGIDGEAMILATRAQEKEVLLERFRLKAVKPPEETV